LLARVHLIFLRASSGEEFAPFSNFLQGFLYSWKLSFGQHLSATAFNMLLRGVWKAQHLPSHRAEHWPRNRLVLEKQMKEYVEDGV
jgi:hypothetical protein